MRLYANTENRIPKTQKAQGAFITKVFQEQMGQSARLLKMCQGSHCTEWSRHGFVVLETLFDTALYHYAFCGGYLTLTPEAMLETDQEAFLDCPVSYLAITKAKNPHWRLRVANFKASVKLLSSVVFANGQLFVFKHPFNSGKHYEEFVAVERHDGDWFGIESDGRRSFLSMDRETMNVHGGELVDPMALPAVDSSLLEGVMDNGTVIYRIQNGTVELLGRPLTRAERIERDLAARSAPFGIVYDEVRPFWS